MFTGIVTGMGKIAELNPSPGFLRYAVKMDPSHLANLHKGASISISGICQTVVEFDDKTVWFDAIGETLKKTTLSTLKIGSPVNLERSAKIGDEIGGHLLSGHIFGTAEITSIDKQGNNCIVQLKCPAEWTKYLLPKGFVALDGASLTLVDVDRKTGLFTVHLIPETLARTTFGNKKKGDKVNLELDSQTQTIVDTIERIYTSKSTS
jgi:riboflavin synthase